MYHMCVLLKNSHLFSYVSNALFLSYNEKGRISEILDTLPDNFEISVVTDGSRILGLGDLGVDGVGEPLSSPWIFTSKIR